jgi:hypothetical protein
MMQFYISPTGEVIEPCEHDGTEVPIEARFTPEFVAALRPYDPESEPNPPEREPPPVPAPTADEVLAQRDALLAVAALRIAPLQDAVDLDVETGDEVAALTEWKQYRVDLNRIELQAGFPDAIEWPVAPT